MASSQAGFLAKQGLSMLYNATVTSVSAISSGIGMAYKTYTDHYEKNQIETLRKSGKKPADVIHEVLQRFYFLSLAGYNNEVAAAAQKIAAKLTSGGEKSTVTFECVAALSGVLVTTCSKYGDAGSGGWGLQDFLNSARMGKDHFDRDQLVADLYFAFLFAQDIAGGPGPEFERIVREAAGRMIEGDAYTSETPTGYGAAGAYTPSAYTSTAGLPSYAQVPSAFGSSSSAKPSSASAFGSGSSINLAETDPKKRTAKILGVLASSIKKAVDEADSKRVRSLREAEEMLQREKAKAAQQSGGVPSAYGSTTPAVPSGFGSGSSFGGSAAPAAAKPTGFGSSNFKSGGSSFGGASTGASAFGSGSSFGGGSGGSGFGSASLSGGGGSNYGSSSGFGSNTASGGGGGWANFGSNNTGYSTVGAPSTTAPNGFGGSRPQTGSSTNFLGL